MKNFIQNKKLVIKQQLDFGDDLNKIVAKYMGTEFNFSSIERRKDQNFITLLLDLIFKVNDDAFALAQGLNDDAEKRQDQADKFLNDEMSQSRIDEMIKELFKKKS